MQKLLSLVLFHHSPALWALAGQSLRNSLSRLCAGVSVMVWRRKLSRELLPRNSFPTSTHVVAFLKDGHFKPFLLEQACSLESPQHSHDWISCHSWSRVKGATVGQGLSFQHTPHKQAATWSPATPAPMMAIFLTWEKSFENSSTMPCLRREDSTSPALVFG